MAESSRKRFKAFDGRAATLLNQTSQLATLCGSPACIAIYNPDDVTRPWRIWPDNEADFRSVIQTYNNSKKLKRQTAQKSNATRCRKAAATIDDVGSSPSSQFGEYRSATPSGRNGLLSPQLTPLEMDLTTSQARFDKCIVPLPPAATLEQQDSVLAGKERALGGKEAGEALASNASITIAPPQAAATVEQDFVLVGKEEAWAGKEAGEAQAVNTTNVEDADASGIHSFASSTAADTVFDGLLSCEWGDTELFELVELLNSSDDQGMMTLL